jgi:hypothetical protein
MLIAELALVYFLGAVSGAPLARQIRRRWRKVRRRQAWDGYFQN